MKEDFKKSNWYKHAIDEFKIAGYIPLDQEQEEGPNRWIQENVLELLEVLSNQGHSGSSIGYCLNIFNKLAKFEPITPITCTDNEWVEHNYSGSLTYQNNRLSAVFKNDKDSKPYYLDAIVFRDQNGSCFTGTVEDISSAQYIRTPFTPKTFYIDVISNEVEKDDETKLCPGSGWWHSTIKDTSQLEEVWKFYDFMKIEK